MSIFALHSADKLTNRPSWTVGILSSVECGERSHSLRIGRFDFDIHSAYSNGCVGLLPNHRWHRPWVWNPNGVYIVPQSFNLRHADVFQPILAIQNDVPPAQNSVGMALVIFFQTFGGSLFLTFAQTIFDQRLVDDLREYAPTVDPQTVVKAGATAIRQVVTPEQLGGVLEAYNKAVNDNFYLAAGASAATFCLAWGIGWRKISKKKVGRPEA